jgi:fatty acid desaturase
MPEGDGQRGSYLGIDISKATIQRMSSTDLLVSIVKVALYFGLIAAFVALYLSVDVTFVHALCVLALGILFAHGVELQHEALHGNLFRSPIASRVVGFLTGAPMLVSFVQYRAYHLHHHRCVGTNRDEELFDYSLKSLANLVSAAVRIWNLVKVPMFLVTYFNMLQGVYPDKVRESDRRALFWEYSAMLALLCVTAGAALLGDHRLLMLWLLPWLAVAEPLHFMIEVPEHLGCDRATRSILRNTRSYRAHPLWGYLINYNNFHIEHHLFPTVPAHRLGRLHSSIRQADGHCTDGYWQAVREVRSAARREPAQ